MTYCNYENIACEVASVARDAGRAPEDVQLIAVSKTVGNDAVAAAIEQGARHFGENRPDCLIEKAQANPQVTWHFIGNIQSRRIPDIVRYSALIHSLYQLKHAEKIEKTAAEIGKIQDVLVEVNVSGEESKAGCTPDEAGRLVECIQSLPHVRVLGLMTMAPIALSDSEKFRVYETFEGLRKLRDTIRDNLSDKAQNCADGTSETAGVIGSSGTGYANDARVNGEVEQCVVSGAGDPRAINSLHGASGAINSLHGASDVGGSRAINSPHGSSDSGRLIDTSDFSQLSMGMSGDWREAIASGATMVRIGRAIFSPKA